MNQMTNRRKVQALFASFLAVFLVGAWQYSKFVNGHGVFHAISPRHGGIILLGCLVVAMAVLVYL